MERRKVTFEEKQKRRKLALDTIVDIAIRIIEQKQIHKERTWKA